MIILHTPSNASAPLNGTQVIEAMEAVKYLGLWIDRRLQWNHHIKATRTKATTSIGGLTRIAGSTWGCNYTSMRQLYQAIVIPQLSYCCSAWYQPEGSPGHCKAQISSLQTVQSRAARLITGAFKATSIAALDVEAHTLPIKHLLDKLSNEAVLRLASSPSYNDIIKPRSTRWNSKRRPKKDRKRSALERHTMNFEARHGNISQIEKLRPFSASPEWEPPTTIVAGSKKDATLLAKDSMDAGLGRGSARGSDE